MLSVDLDGNPSLRGSSNIKVLINNKPSTILASSISDALKQIPADMIKTVEVITSPSAKYDAEGSAGIINIVTKKNTLQGLTFSFDSSAGVRGSNLSMNGNFRNKTWGMTLGGFGRSEYNVNGHSESIQTTSNNGVLTRNVQTSDTRRSGCLVIISWALIGILTNIIPSRPHPELVLEMVTTGVMDCAKLKMINYLV